MVVGIRQSSTNLNWPRQIRDRDADDVDTLCRSVELRQCAKGLKRDRIYSMAISLQSQTPEKQTFKRLKRFRVL